MSSFPLVNRAFQGISDVYHRPVWNSKATIGKLALCTLPVVGMFVSTNQFLSMQQEAQAIQLCLHFSDEEAIPASLALLRQSILFRVASIICGIATAFFIFAVSSGALIHVGGVFYSAYHAYHLDQGVRHYTQRLQDYPQAYQPT